MYSQAQKPMQYAIQINTAFFFISANLPHSERPVRSCGTDIGWQDDLFLILIKFNG